MLLLVMSAKKPLDRIEIAFTLLSKALKILFFNGVTGLIIERTDKERQDLREVAKIMTCPSKPLLKKEQDSGI